MSQQITQVDAFTNTPFAGNPAGVCVLPQAAEAEWMQHVAREMNVAETAFLYRQEDGFHLRWFTPVAEVDLCGHATLASAHILWEDGHLRPDEQARFHTRSGLLTAVRRGDWIEMDFPATPAEPVPAADVPADLLAALGVEPLFVGKSIFDYLVEVDSDAVLRALKPDLLRLERVPARGVIVTARSASPDHDVISRFFAPAVGVPEDSVTGSAHSALMPYWSAKLSKSELRAYQASPRGGELRLSLHGVRVYISGQAVTVLRGKLLA